MNNKKKMILSIIAIFFVTIATLVFLNIKNKSTSDSAKNEESNISGYACKNVDEARYKFKSQCIGIMTYNSISAGRSGSIEEAKNKAYCQCVINNFNIESVADINCKLTHGSAQGTLYSKEAKYKCED